MRFMIMHKTNARWEAGAKPDAQEMQRVGAMVGELQRSGALLGGEGLGPSAQGARVRVGPKEHSVTPGPFGGGNPLPARYAHFRASSVDEAAAIAARFGRIFGEVVVDVRPVNEIWDLGFAPKPEGLTTRRYMAVVNADAASEAGTPLRAEQHSALRSFADDLTRTGALIGIEHLEPSRKAKRLRPPTDARASGSAGAKPKYTVIDGPFTETKELLGGFVMVELPSIDDAVRLAQDYVAVVDVEEVDVRIVANAS